MLEAWNNHSMDCRSTIRQWGTSVAAVLAVAAVSVFVGSASASAEAGEAAAETEEDMKPYTEKIETEDESFEFEMVPIPGGTFTMGSPEDEAEEYRQDHEGPQFEVEVEPFWMGSHEVTWDEYDVFLEQYNVENAEGYREIPEDRQADAVSYPTPQYEEGIEIIVNMGPREGRPAVDMSQLAAKQYTKWLSKKTGRFYRLPTEAEWEYAARAGTDTAYHFGDDEGDLDEYGWHFDNADDKYHKPGQKEPNTWGLYDMHGNVAEWVIDQYIPDYYEQFAGEDGPVKASEIIAWPEKQFPIVVRGGSWWHYSDELRSATRLMSDFEWNEKDPQIPQSIWWHTEAFWVGFRVVRPLEVPDEEVRERFWEPNDDYIRDLMLNTSDKQIRGLVEESVELEG